MAHLTKKANRKLHADLSGLTGFNVKLKRKEVIQNPREVTFKNGRKAIRGVGSDGTPMFRIIKGWSNLAQTKQKKAMMIQLHRLKDFEGDGVKFAVANKDESVVGTLIQSRDFPDEMEIRITDGNERFSVRGHKSILNNLTREQFADKVERNLLTHRELKNK